MPACPPNWDTLSGWQHPRKPCPKLSAQNGMYFPDGMPSGNRVPESRPRMGQTFRLKRPAETASRNRRSNWDAVSGFLLFRKARPILEPKSGTQFPVEGCSGKRIPFQAAIPGHSFRRYKTTIRRPYHRPSNMRSRDTKQQIECSFSKKYTSRNLPILHNSLPFKVANYRPPIQLQKMTSKPGHLPAWLDFGQLLVS